jgi:multiple sugar transport system permease protein
MTLNSAKSNSTSRSPRRVLLGVAIATIAIFCLAPILWQLLTSFKVDADIVAIPNIYLPDRLTLDSYLDLFRSQPFLRYIFNSTFVSLVSTLACLTIGSPAAYALARLQPQEKNLILAGILLVVLFPSILLLQGLLEIVRFLHLGNNYLSLIVTYTAINLPLTILVLRSFFERLPKDLEDAAKIDGYNTLQMFVGILMPLTLPALATTGILTFIAAWNEFIFALTFITEDSMKTIPVASAQIGGMSVYEIPYGRIAAATVIGTLPLAVLVLLFQRQIIRGLTAGAVKG